MVLNITLPIPGSKFQVAPDFARGASRHCHRSADGPRPQHIGRSRTRALFIQARVLHTAASRDGSRSGGGSVEMRPFASIWATRPQVC